jgi:serine/threonine protein kinase
VFALFHPSIRLPIAPFSNIPHLSFDAQARFSTKSDVWSFGVTMWEVLTLGREVPFSTMTDDEVIDNCDRWYGCSSSSDDADLPPPAAPVHLDRPALCPREIYDLLCECWQRDEDRRPSFHDVHMFLQRKNCGFNPVDERSSASSGYASVGIGSAATMTRFGNTTLGSSASRSTAVPSYV